MSSKLSHWDTHSSCEFCFLHAHMGKASFPCCPKNGKKSKIAFMAHLKCMGNLPIAINPLIFNAQKNYGYLRASEDHRNTVQQPALMVASSYDFHIMILFQELRTVPGEADLHKLTAHSEVPSIVSTV